MPTPIEPPRRAFCLDGEYELEHRESSATGPPPAIISLSENDKSSIDKCAAAALTGSDRVWHSVPITSLDHANPGQAFQLLEFPLLIDAWAVTE